jgi:hypothetical protein
VYTTVNSAVKTFFALLRNPKWGDNDAASLAIATSVGQNYYNRLMSETKPFRLTESVKAAG